MRRPNLRYEVRLKPSAAAEALKLVADFLHEHNLEDGVCRRVVSVV